MENKNRLVWYVCYGSNMHLKRFMCYLTGESYDEYKLKKGVACNNSSKPKEIKNVEIPFGIYFANQSRTWNHYGTAFLKPNKGSGRAICRAYLITVEQYEHVKKFEGPKYQHEIKLDDIDGYPTVTFTNEEIIYPYNLPNEKYLECIERGLTEMGLNENEIKTYIREEIFNKDSKKYEPEWYVQMRTPSGFLLNMPIYPGRSLNEQVKEYNEHFKKASQEKKKK